jgi:hypothetical protein
MGLALGLTSCWHDASPGNDSGVGTDADTDADADDDADDSGDSGCRAAPAPRTPRGVLGNVGTLLFSGG